MSTSDSCSVTACRAEWDAKYKVVVLPPRTFARGLTKVLYSLFSPEFAISRVMQKLPRRRRKHGRAVGNLVDDELSRWVRDPSYQGSTRFAAVRRALTEKGWRPFRAQVPVGCSRMRLGTRVDLVCLDRKNRLIIVELKTGFDDYFYTRLGNMRSPFEQVPISCYARACLQLAVTTWLWEHAPPAGFKDRTVAGSYLVRVFSDPDTEPLGAPSVEILPLPAWTRQPESCLQACIDKLVASRHQTKRQRSRELKNGSARVRRRRKTYSLA